MDILPALSDVLEQRKRGNPNESNVASLYAAGTNKILEKVGEEAAEVIIAAKDASLPAADSSARDALVGEVADLWFHTMVLLGHLDLSISDVEAVLAERFGLGGLAEKASRDKS